jgi:hypothetical protein
MAGKVKGGAFNPHTTSTWAAFGTLKYASKAALAGGSFEKKSASETAPRKSASGGYNDGVGGWKWECQIYIERYRRGSE